MGLSSTRSPREALPLPGDSPSTGTYLAIQSKQEKHNKKENGPKSGQRHHSHSFRVGNEGQAGT